MDMWVGKVSFWAESPRFCWFFYGFWRGAAPGKVKLNEHSGRSAARGQRPRNPGMRSARLTPGNAAVLGQLTPARSRMFSFPIQSLIPHNRKGRVLGTNDALELSRREPLEGGAPSARADFLPA